MSVCGRMALCSTRSFSCYHGSVSLPCDQCAKSGCYAQVSCLVSSASYASYASKSALFETQTSCRIFEVAAAQASRQLQRRRAATLFTPASAHQPPVHAVNGQKSSGRLQRHTSDNLFIFVSIQERTSTRCFDVMATSAQEPDQVEHTQGTASVQLYFTPFSQSFIIFVCFDWPLQSKHTWLRFLL